MSLVGEKERTDRRIIIVTLNEHLWMLGSPLSVPSSGSHLETRVTSVSHMLRKSKCPALGIPTTPCCQLEILHAWRLCHDLYSPNYKCPNIVRTHHDCLTETLLLIPIKCHLPAKRQTVFLSANPSPLLKEPGTRWQGLQTLSLGRMIFFLC